MARARVRTWLSAGCLRGTAARTCECPARCAGPGEPRSGVPAEGKATPGRQDAATHRSLHGRLDRASPRIGDEEKKRAGAMPRPLMLPAAGVLAAASLPVGVLPPLPCFRPRPVPARGPDRCGQNVTLQLLSVPVSPLPLSLTRRFQVPFRLSPDRSTV